MSFNNRLSYFALGFGAAVATYALLSTVWRHGNLTLDGPKVYRRKKVVAFGDSITQHGFNTDNHGWVAKLADWWTRRVDVLNRGYSGYNSRWAKLAFQEEFTMFLGQSILRISEAWSNWQSRTLQYVEQVKAIGSQYAIPVVDAWTAMEGATVNRAKYLPDGLHLNANGNLALLKAVKAVIRTNFPAWLPEVMPMQLPEWSQIDYTHPAHSFAL
eukprot:gene5138-6547_t